MIIKEDVLGVICKVFDVKKEELKLDESLEDSLGVDSTEMVEFLIAMNKQIGVNLRKNEITKIHTPNQIIEIIEKNR